MGVRGRHLVHVGSACVNSGYQAFLLSLNFVEGPGYKASYIIRWGRIVVHQVHYLLIRKLVHCDPGPQMLVLSLVKPVRNCDNNKVKYVTQ